MQALSTKYHQRGARTIHLPLAQPFEKCQRHSPPLPVFKLFFGLVIYQQPVACFYIFRGHDVPNEIHVPDKSPRSRLITFLQGGIGS